MTPHPADRAAFQLGQFRAIARDVISDARSVRSSLALKGDDERVREWALRRIDVMLRDLERGMEETK